MFAIDFSGERGFVLTPEEAAEAGIRYDLPGVPVAAGPPVRNLELESTPVALEEYRKAFDRVVRHLKRGDT